MEIYAVLRIDKSFKIVDSLSEVKLPDGQFAIPAFSDYEKAKEIAGDKFEILTFKIEK
jgi:hypothetical protein